MAVTISGYYQYDSVESDYFTCLTQTVASNNSIRTMETSGQQAILASEDYGAFNIRCSYTSGHFYYFGAVDSGSTSGLGTSTAYFKSVYAYNYYATSDKRDKTNIETSTLDFVDIVSKINICEFNFKNDKDKTNYIGVIAQELRDILPKDKQELFVNGKETDTEYLSVNEDKFVYLGIGAIQSLSKKLDDLETKLDNVLAKYE